MSLRHGVLQKTTLSYPDLAVVRLSDCAPLFVQAAAVWAEIAPDNLQQMALRLQGAYMAGDLEMLAKAAEAILRPESRITAILPSRTAFRSAETGEERTWLLGPPLPRGDGTDRTPDDNGGLCGTGEDTSDELQLLARCLFHDLRHTLGQASQDAATEPEEYMHISTDPDHDPAADPSAGVLSPLDQVVRLWGIACEQYALHSPAPRTDPPAPLLTWTLCS